jgi:hypothetical protein
VGCGQVENMLGNLNKREGLRIGVLHVGDGQSSAASQYYSGLHFVARQYCREELVKLDKVCGGLFKSAARTCMEIFLRFQTCDFKFSRPSSMQLMQHF